MSILLVEPWYGEFGWELMAWQAYARKMSRDHETSIVCCRADRTYLYEDFADIFIHATGAEGNDTEVHKCHDRSEAQQYLTDMAASLPHNTSITPCSGVRKLADQDFIVFGEPMGGYDVVIHARQSDKRGSGYRNYSLSSWAKIAESLLSHGLKVACIGTQALNVPNCENLRHLSLRTVCNVLRSSKLILGPTSGPIHLAALCLTPIVCWTDTKKPKPGRPGHIIERLQETWNPFNVKTRIIEGWRPDPRHIVREALLALG